jgi:hypothetical protein
MNVSNLLPVPAVNERTMADLRELPFEYDSDEDVRYMYCGCKWDIARQTIRMCWFHAGFDYAVNSLSKGQQ